MTDSLHALHGAAWAALAVLASPLAAQDWPQWGRDEARNMTVDVKGLPVEFKPGRFVGADDAIDPKTSKHARWSVRLGSQSYGNPTVAGGRVYVGTNNDTPRDERLQGDRSCVYCLDEKTGAFLWQLCVPKLGTGPVSDWEFVGICSSPAVVGDRVYVVTNRCEVMCLDAHGMANGNDGFQGEGQYLAGPSQPAMDVGQTDADIIWSFDMMKECGVSPHNITSCSVLVVGDRVWTSTSNGVAYGRDETPAPEAPSLIVLDKHTGQLLGREASGLSERMFHSNWSSPAYLRTEAGELCVFGGPDGVLYAFDADPGEGGSGGGGEDEPGAKVLKQVWACDCNPTDYRTKDGQSIPYGAPKGPSEVLATPVVADDLIYVVIGQDPEHGEGLGHLTCVSPSGEVVWTYRKIKRSMSTMAVRDGLVFAADYSGFIYCLDAKTGEEYWVHDTAAHIWGSVLVADGRVFVGTEDGFLTVLPATKEYNEAAVQEVDFMTPIYSSPIAANGALYVATHTHLFCFSHARGDK